MKRSSYKNSVFALNKYNGVLHLSDVLEKIVFVRVLNYPLISSEGSDKCKYKKDALARAENPKKLQKLASSELF